MPAQSPAGPAPTTRTSGRNRPPSAGIDLTPALLGSHVHASANRRYAGACVRYAVDDYVAGRAPPDAAEKPPRPVQLDALAERGYAVGRQSGGDGLVLVATDGLAIEAEFKRSAAVEVEYGMLVDPQLNTREMKPQTCPGEAP